MDRTNLAGQPAPAPPSASALARIHAALGPDSQLVLVGGAVRDRLLGREGGDWDLASILLPETVMARARAAGMKVIPTGLQHGTVTIMEAGCPFEITTFRGEGQYLDGRRPDSVTLGVDLEQDLARRDFTINAMALPAEALDSPDWPTRLVDPFGGQQDLEAGIIRAVGQPLERFQEDGLRCLRACRFAAQLGFEIEPETLAAIPPSLAVAGKVAVERAFTELTKLLTGARPKPGLVALAETGLLGLWLPELVAMIGCEQNRYHCYPVWEHTLEVIKRTPPEPDLRWACLLHDCGKPAARSEDPCGGAHFHGHERLSVELAGTILNRLRASHALTRRVLALVRHHGTHPGAAWTDAACRQFLKQLLEDDLPLERWALFRLADQSGKGFGGRECLADHRAILGRLQALAASHPPLAIRDLALGGKALLAVAAQASRLADLSRPQPAPPVQAGPWLGELQKFLLEAVLSDPGLNTPAGLEHLAGTWLGARQ